MSAVATEFASSSRSSSVGLPYEFHFRCKRTFEASDLKDMLRITTQLLAPYCSAEGQAAVPQDIGLIVVYLRLAEQILQWQVRTRE